MSDRPTLIACSHGTKSPRGRQAIHDLIDQIQALLPGVHIEEAFVDVQEPAIDEVVARVALSSSAVVVPLLLSTGFHTEVDITAAVAPYEHVVAAPALGPHDLLALALESRLATAPVAEAGFREGDAVVLAAAGSTNPAASKAVEFMAERLALCIQAPVTVGFSTGVGPRLTDAVEAARAAGARRVIAASYVLAPGFFADQVARSGADSFTAPLTPDVRVAGVAAERYLAAAALL